MKCLEDIKMEKCQLYQTWKTNINIEGLDKLCPSVLIYITILLYYYENTNKNW